MFLATVRNEGPQAGHNKQQMRERQKEVRGVKARGQNKDTL